VPTSACYPTCVLDGTVQGYGPPTPDAAAPPSLWATAVTRNATTLVGELTRALVSLKPHADYTVSLTEPMHVLWSASARKRLDTTLSALPMHRARGSESVDLAAGGDDCVRFGDSATPPNHHPQEQEEGGAGAVATAAAAAAEGSAEALLQTITANATAAAAEAA
jgi:hypothetical protein